MSFLVKEITPDHTSVYRLNGRNKRIGLIGWFGMYTTGAVLFFLILSHLGVVHYLPTERTLSLETISQSLRSYYSLRIIDMGLLVFCIVHGLIGLRRVILDLEILGKTGDRCLIWSFTALGVVLFIFGYAIFYRLLSAKIS